MTFPDRSLYLLFTPSACSGDPWDTLAAALDGGVDLVQWRVEAPDREGFDRCREQCRRAGVPVIVNDDVMFARRNRAAGAHVGQDDMPAEAARKLLGELWLGVSAHEPQQIDAACNAGADYVGFGPCHPTTTKGYATGKSPAEIEAAGNRGGASRPLFAIGGITPANLPPLRALGVDRIAVCGAILAAADPRAAAAALRRWL